MPRTSGGTHVPTSGHPIASPLSFCPRLPVRAVLAVPRDGSVSPLLQPPGISEGHRARGAGKPGQDEALGIDQSAVAFLEVRYRCEVDAGIAAAGMRRGSYYTLRGIRTRRTK